MNTADCRNASRCFPLPAVLSCCFTLSLGQVAALVGMGLLVLADVQSRWFPVLQPSLHAYLGSCLCPCPELRSECLREKRGTLPPLRSELCTNTHHICFSFKTDFLGRPVPPALQSRKQMQQASCAALTSEVLSPNCQGSSGRT